MLKVLDHYARAIARFASQFFSSSKLKGLVGAHADEVQRAEDSIHDMGQAIRNPSVATSTTLDNIGKLVGAPARAGKTDVAYRARVATQIVANASLGNNQDVYAAAQAMIPQWAAAGACKITNEGVGSFEIRCEPATSTTNVKQDAVDLAIAMSNVAPAGVQTIVISREATPTFKFGSGATGPQGFGNGKLIAAYSFKG